MFIYIVEETPEYDIFGAIMGTFLIREEAEEYAKDLTYRAFYDGYNSTEHVILNMMKDNCLVSCGIYGIENKTESMINRDVIEWDCSVDWELEKTTGYAATVHALEIPDSCNTSDVLVPYLFCDYLNIVRESATYRHFSNILSCSDRSGFAPLIDAARTHFSSVSSTCYRDEKYRHVEMFEVIGKQTFCFCVYDTTNPFLSQFKAVDQGRQSLPDPICRIPYNWRIVDRASYVVEIWKESLPIVIGPDIHFKPFNYPLLLSDNKNISS